MFSTAACAWLVAASAQARLVEIMKPWGRVWISVPEPAGDALPRPSARGLAYRAAIEAAASKCGVDPLLVEAIVACESAFDPNAISSAGAMGLMQLMPETARGLGVTDAFDSTQNLDGGTRHLATLLTAFGGDRRLAVAAYNAGEGAVRRAGGIPQYPETQHYVRKVEYYLGQLSGGVVMASEPTSQLAESEAAPAPVSEPEPTPAPRRGRPVVMGRDADGRLVFVNKQAKDQR